MASTATHRISKLNLSGGDASGIQDAAERRRIQNRINQRASRARKALKSGKGPTKQSDRWVIYTDGAKSPMQTSTAITTTIPSPPETRHPLPESATHMISSQVCFNAASEWYNRKYRLVKELESQVAIAAARSLDSIQLLAPVTHYNIITAMMNNARIMGLSLHELEADIASQFNIAGPIELDLPASLQPSESQRAIIHHPWIDLVPMQSFRDVLLNNMDKYDEDEFCGDLHGQIGVSDGLGLITWGESWDPNAYELSEPIFRKWYWILKDCPEILRTTNYWRRKRGEKPLRFDQPVGFVHPEEVAE